LPRDQVWLSGWELLGQAIFARVKANMWKVLAPMICLVLLSLWLAFKRPREILLSVGVLLLSGLCLLSVMKLAGWSWNLLNLMAVPLILGTGVDYGIFMQLALRRYHGDLVMAHRAVGRALLLCGGTAIAGFGSLGLSTNAGMASLGQVCAVGIGFNMLISIFLLPRWAKVSSVECRVSNAEGNAVGSSPLAPRHSSLSRPSSLYRPEFWRIGLGLVRFFPQGFAAWLSRSLAGLYWLLARHRRRVVIENFAPALGRDSKLAEKKARRLFDYFALKLVDLWRYEAGLPIDHLLGQNSGWEHFKAAQAQKRGVLVVTPHLGNWEFGAPWLARLGVQLQVITLAEPGQGFTELRKASRARWNIDTLVIGEDPFASIEIVRRLEAGSTVALLIDRPPPPTAVTVELFSRPFTASIAAAELARASGCVILPVYLPRVGSAYDAHLLPAITYDRAALRDREVRRHLTQQIITALEPIIRKYIDQWYHFVPVWPEPKEPSDSP
jgi:lauroyl/myristoyl acyltransferase